MTTNHPARCPRCGYDLSGTVATWNESCPLHGICSECGLEVQWANLLNPSLSVATWSFEHAIGRVFRRLALTSLIAMLPWLLWSKLRMEAPIITRRLLLLIATWLLAAHLILGVEKAVLNYEATLLSGAATTAPKAAALAAPSLLWPYATSEWVGPATWRSHDVPSPIGVASFVLLILMALAPLTLLLMPESLRKAKVRHVHIVRSAVYSLAILPILAAIWAVASLMADLGLNLGSWSPWAYQPAAGAAIMALAVAWQWTYWWMFVRRYLRLPHSSLVATITILLPALALATLLMVVNGPRTYSWATDWWWHMTRITEQMLGLP